VQSRLSVQCFRFTEDLRCFHNKRGCQTIRLKASACVRQPGGRVCMSVGSDDGRATDRPTDRRSALHHRLRRCWLPCRARRRTGSAIASSSFNTKSAERRDAEHTLQNCCYVSHRSRLRHSTMCHCRQPSFPYDNPLPKRSCYRHPPARASDHCISFFFRALSATSVSILESSQVPSRCGLIPIKTLLCRFLSSAQP